jgi:hypothetical protein
MILRSDKIAMTKKEEETAMAAAAAGVGAGVGGLEEPPLVFWNSRLKALLLPG